MSGEITVAPLDPPSPRKRAWRAKQDGLTVTPKRRGRRPVREVWRDILLAEDLDEAFAFALNHTKRTTPRREDPTPYAVKMVAEAEMMMECAEVDELCDLISWMSGKGPARRNRLNGRVDGILLSGVREQWFLPLQHFRKVGWPKQRLSL